MTKNTDTQTLARDFEAAVPNEFSQPLAFRAKKRVVLVAASLIDLYNGRRYALQTQAESLGPWHTEAIIHSAVTAAEWLHTND